MKLKLLKTGHLFTINLLLLQTLIIGCDSPSEKVKDAQNNVSDAKKDLSIAEDEYLAEVTAFKKESEAKITENDKNIAIVKSKVATVKKEGKVSYEKQVAELEQKNIKLKKKIAEYKEKGKENWQSFKMNLIMIWMN